MNYTGAVGDVMRGSGLENVLELLYCSNTLEYVLTGKAFARAVRGHIIVNDALIQLLLQHSASGDSLTESSEADNQTCARESAVSRLQQLYGEIWTNKIDIDSCNLLELCEEFKQVDDILQQTMRIYLLSLTRQSCGCNMSTMLMLLSCFCLLNVLLIGLCICTRVQ